MEKVGEGVKVKHIKGWGELDKEDLKPLAMDPETRRLIKIMPSQGNDKRDFVRLMNDDVEYRRELIGV